jgi:hypothetical protein
VVALAPSVGVLVAVPSVGILVVVSSGGVVHRSCCRQPRELLLPLVLLAV